jgi:hypothetical protein
MPDARARQVTRDVRRQRAGERATRPAIPRRGNLPCTAAVATLLLVAPASATAQACLASPTLRGEFPVGAAVASWDDSREYRLQAGANLEGPLAFLSSLGIIQRDDSDDSGFVGAGTGLVETGFGAFSLCPIGGFRHATWTSDVSSDVFGDLRVDSSELSFPFGIGIGTHMGDESWFRFVPAIGAGIVLSQLRSTTSTPGSDIEDSGTRTRERDASLYFSVGAGVGLGPAFVRAEWRHLTLDRADPVATLNVGVRLRGERATLRTR